MTDERKTVQLKDVQSTKDERGINIQKVGINDVDVPLTVQIKNGSEQIVNAKARMSVDLPMQYKGTHMSRFMEVLNLYQRKKFSGTDIRPLLSDIQKVLKAKNAHARFQFKYFVEKESPVTKLSFPAAYECMLDGNLTENEYELTLGVKVPVTTLCPCSKEISRFSAHNQRAIINVKITCAEGKIVWIEDLIKTVEECASCPVYPLLKRSDEKYVTEKAYLNPKFVEDTLRDVVLQLRSNDKIVKFEAETEAFESIHNHNAWAYQAEDKRS